jgi:hypothetical protein
MAAVRGVLPMHEKRRPTDAEIAEIRRRRPGVRASLACEGMELTVEEEALFDQMERERLTPDEGAKRIVEFSRAKRRQKAPAPA